MKRRTQRRRILAAGGALAVALLGLVITAAAVAPSASAAAPATPAVAPATDAHGQLQDPALQSRFEQITKELRCLVCQNESIADSNAELAGDLRKQVQELLVAGKSDDDIFDFMTQRYGEFVRFSPPLSAKSLFIWGAPFLMLLLGGFIIYRVARARGAMPLDDEIAAGPDLK